MKWGQSFAIMAWCWKMEAVAKGIFPKSRWNFFPKPGITYMPIPYVFKLKEYYQTIGNLLWPWWLSRSFCQRGGNWKIYKVELETKESKLQLRTSCILFSGICLWSKFYSFKNIHPFAPDILITLQYRFLSIKKLNILIRECWWASISVFQEPAKSEDGEPNTKHCSLINCTTEKKGWHRLVTPKYAYSQVLHIQGWPARATPFSL